jgi:hypothetical protein
VAHCGRVGSLGQSSGALLSVHGPSKCRSLRKYQLSPIIQHRLTPIHSRKNPRFTFMGNRPLRTLAEERTKSLWPCENFWADAAFIKAYAARATRALLYVLVEVDGAVNHDCPNRKVNDNWKDYLHITSSLQGLRAPRIGPPKAQKRANLGLVLIRLQQKVPPTEWLSTNILPSSNSNSMHL